jgi:hypothetical protein
MAIFGFSRLYDFSATTFAIFGQFRALILACRDRRAGHAILRPYIYSVGMLSILCDNGLAICGASV